MLTFTGHVFFFSQILHLLKERRVEWVPWWPLRLILITCAEWTLLGIHGCEKNQSQISVTFSGKKNLKALMLFSKLDRGAYSWVTSLAQRTLLECLCRNFSIGNLLWHLHRQRIFFYPVNIFFFFIFLYFHFSFVNNFLSPFYSVNNFLIFLISIFVNNVILNGCFLSEYQRRMMELCCIQVRIISLCLVSFSVMVGSLLSIIFLVPEVTL